MDWYIEVPCFAMNEKGERIKNAYIQVPKDVFDQYWLFRHAAQRNFAALVKKCGGDIDLANDLVDREK